MDRRKNMRKFNWSTKIENFLMSLAWGITMLIFVWWLVGYISISDRGNGEYVSFSGRNGGDKVQYIEKQEKEKERQKRFEETFGIKYNE
jgi:hypothetical protein